MKTRNGFVSNSSSSSFIFVGFPRSEIIDDTTIDHKAIVTKNVFRKQLDSFAMDNLSDVQYVDYQSGKTTDDFWKKVYEHFKEECGCWEAPAGYEPHEVYGSDHKEETWVGIVVAYVSETGTKVVDLKKIEEATKKIKNDYPDVTPCIILAANGY
jgi:hypothetical protein